ncbi:MAG: sugar transferase [Pseudolactococcus laudensis]
MNKWVTFTLHGEGANAIQKVNADVREVAMQMGYKPLYIFRYDGSNESDEALNARIDGITAAVKPGDIILYLYPVLNGFRFDKTFIGNLKARGCRFAISILDSEQLRYPKELFSYEQVGKEYTLFNQAEALIVHGQAMADKLKELGNTSMMIQRGPFDYLMSDTEAQLTNHLQKKLTFVGSFDKSPFISTWNYQTELSVFGSLYYGNSKETFPISPKVEFLGIDNFLQRIPRDRFGIFWDEGFNYQVYSRYTSPHKVALYLSLGIPLIVWEESATAVLVNKYGLGFTITSLDEIDTLLQNTSDEALVELKKRVNEFSYFIREGSFTRRAIRELEQGLFNGFWAG